jgi:type II secretory pathway component PulM
MTRPTLPPALLEAWDRATPRERVLVAWALALVVLALAWAFAWQPLTRDLARSRDILTRERATLAALKAAARPASANASSPARAPDLRRAIDAALDRAGLRALAQPVDGDEGRVSLLFADVGFERVVALTDALARDGVRLTEARLTARVDPGRVRAELAFGR